MAIIRSFRYCRKLVLNNKEIDSRTALSLTKPTKYQSKEFKSISPFVSPPHFRCHLNSSLLIYTEKHFKFILYFSFNVRFFVQNYM